MSLYSRREFFKKGISFGAASWLAGKPHPLRGEPPAGGMRAVSSGNGLRATEKAMALMKTGSDPLDAVIAGVNIVEDDPNDMSVGYGGLPNEDGVVELDASVMHGPTHDAGAVAGLRNIKNPSLVAKLVMERSDHVLLAGEGALRFAKAHGFKEEELLTDKAREIWLRWKENLSDRDNWFPPHKEDLAAELKPYILTYGTINCLAVNERGDLAGVTTTSGLSFKIAGRIGDSPIIGAGLYVDNGIGAAGSTGRGEANLLNLGSYSAVNFMGRGFPPEEACLKTLENIALKTKLDQHLIDNEGRPAFNLNFYAVDKRGRFGAASLWSGNRYAVHDGTENRLRDCAYLFKAKK